MPSRTIPLSTRRFASLRTIVALMLREMATSYGRSPGGYLWAVLEPVLGIALLTLIFSAGFRAPAIGISFPLFYATGILPMLLFTEMAGKVALSLLFSKPLLAYPAVTYVDALIARFLVNLMAQIMVFYVVFTGILLLFETRVTPDFGRVVEGVALTALLALGVGVMNCFLFTIFPIWQRIWSILMRPLFIISCVFFLFETVPQPYQDLLWYNPLIHLVGILRNGFYGSYEAAYVSELYVIGLSLGLTTAGLVFLRRYHRDLIHR